MSLDHNWVVELREGPEPKWQRIRVRNSVTGECEYPTGVDQNGQLLWPEKGMAILN